MSNSSRQNDEIIICQGCENECEVSVGLRHGHTVCLGGNNCPTGEIYALAQATGQTARPDNTPAK